MKFMKIDDMANFISLMSRARSRGLVNLNILSLALSIVCTTYNW